MDDKKIKIWLSIVVFSLMTTGALASYAAQKNNLYKGLEPMQEGFTSVLQYSETDKNNMPIMWTTMEESIQNSNQNLQPKDLNAVREILEKSFNNPQTTNNTGIQLLQPNANSATQTEPTKAPCGNKPLIIKNNEIIGCAGN